jgi:hypothetical protein
MYLSLVLRRGIMSSYVLNWLIEQFLDDADRLSPSVLDGTCHREAWFWTIILGASAVASVEWSNDLEKSQVEIWRRAFDDKIRLGSAVLGLTTWASAQQALKKLGWVESFDGEEEIRQIWERATM